VKPEDKELTEQLEAARNLGGLKQQGMADGLGVSKSTYNRWVTGAKPLPSAYYARRGLVTVAVEITGCPPGTFTSPPATDRVADLQNELEDLKETLASVLFRELDHEEENELRQYLTSGWRSEAQESEAANE
jgi:transcriptional regulator with XRE-family HTH domain